jgi:hypothetical protein
LTARSPEIQDDDPMEVSSDREERTRTARKCEKKAEGERCKRCITRDLPCEPPGGPMRTACAECAREHISCSLGKRKRELEGSGGEKKKRPRPDVELPAAELSQPSGLCNAALLDTMRKMERHMAVTAGVVTEIQESLRVLARERGMRRHEEKGVGASSMDAGPRDT